MVFSIETLVHHLPHLGSSKKLALKGTTNSFAYFTTCYGLLNNKESEEIAMLLLCVPGVECALTV